MFDHVVFGSESLCITQPGFDLALFMRMAQGCPGMIGGMAFATLLTGFRSDKSHAWTGAIGGFVAGLAIMYWSSLLLPDARGLQFALMVAAMLAVTPLTHACKRTFAILRAKSEIYCTNPAKFT